MDDVAVLEFHHLRVSLYSSIWTNNRYLKTLNPTPIICQIKIITITPTAGSVRLPPRSSLISFLTFINTDIYNIFIENSKKLSYAISYRGSRLRLALALLAVTGIRVGDLLPLKMEQVETLFVNHSIKHF